MEFLVILIVWVIARNVEWPLGFQRDEWLIAWRLRAGEALAALPLTVRLVLIVGLPCLLVAALEWLLAPRWGSVPLLALELVVLLYSIGRGDYRPRLGVYLAAWQRGDFEAAYQEAMTRFRFGADMPIGSAAELHAQVRRGVLYQAFERWFAVICLFYFLGPWAALFYRILQLTLAQHGSDEEHRCIRAWLVWIEWLPVRLLGLAFAVTGNFASCFRAWRDHLAGFAPVEDLLVRYAVAAQDGAEVQNDGPDFGQRAGAELLELDALIARSSIAWLVMLALLQMLR